MGREKFLAGRSVSSRAATGLIIRRRRQQPQLQGYKAPYRVRFSRPMMDHPDCAFM